ncbi:MAG: hypothetical protein AVDCRST_MAG67-2732, partial [uncultured Solirubrobacteraceae bacterium]
AIVAHSSAGADARRGRAVRRRRAGVADGHLTQSQRREHGRMPRRRAGRQGRRRHHAPRGSTDRPVARSAAQRGGRLGSRSLRCSVGPPRGGRRGSCGNRHRRGLRRRRRAARRAGLPPGGRRQDGAAGRDGRRARAAGARAR